MCVCWEPTHQQPQPPGKLRVWFLAATVVGLWEEKGIWSSSLLAGRKFTCNRLAPPTATTTIATTTKTKTTTTSVWYREQDECGTSKGLLLDGEAVANTLVFVVVVCILRYYSPLIYHDYTGLRGSIAPSQCTWGNV